MSHVLDADEILRIITGRVFIRMAGGAYLGLAPPESRVGDYVCLLLGCDVPVILRPSKAVNILIGEIYVPGIMYGEGMDRLLAEQSVMREFAIE